MLSPFPLSLRGSFLQRLLQQAAWPSSPWMRAIRRATRESRRTRSEISLDLGQLWFRDLSDFVISPGSLAGEFRLRTRTSIIWVTCGSPDLGHNWFPSLARMSLMRIVFEVWTWGSNIWLITARIGNGISVWFCHFVFCHGATWCLMVLERKTGELKYQRSGDN